MCLVKEVVISRISRLPQQVLLVSLLSKARIPKMLDVLLLNPSLELPEAASEL